MWPEPGLTRPRLRKLKNGKVKVTLPKFENVNYSVTAKLVRKSLHTAKNRTKTVLAPKTQTKFRLAPGKWAISYRLIDLVTAAVGKTSHVAKIRIN